MARRRSRRGRGRQCVVPGCGRRAQAGRVHCASHARQGAGPDELEAAIGQLARRIEQAFAGNGEWHADEADDPEPTRSPDSGRTSAHRRAAVLAEVSQLFGVGELGEVFSERLRAVAGQERLATDTEVELTALRLALARLLTSPELDAVTQAHGIAEVVAVSLRARRRQQETLAFLRALGWVD